jgi:hypothetical protein
MSQFNQEVNAFLTKLRDTGKINMFGAGPYLMAEFALSRAEAKTVLLDWMNSTKKARVTS